MKIIEEALTRFYELQDRTNKLQMAISSLNPDNPHASGVRCSASIEQGTAYEVGVRLHKEVVKPIFEAELARVSSELAELREKLKQATAVLE